MADKNKAKTKRGDKRRARVRGIVFGTAERPRLTVSKSLKNITAQVINDEEAKTITAASSLSKNVISELKKGMTKIEIAAVVGEVIAREAKEQGVETVVFDRNRHRYHGRIKAVADSARKAGLKL
jgi:large subunit ribosomal protein L18